MKNTKWFLAAGVLVGNWLIVPLILESRSHSDGFFIGLIAAVIILLLYMFKR